MASDKPIKPYAQEMLAAMKACNVSIAAALPDSLLESVYRALAEQDEIRYIPVSNEGELPGILAGAYLGGKRALSFSENSGLRQGFEAIAKFAYSINMPMVMVVSYRGDFGEPNYFGHTHGRLMEPVLKALRMPCKVIRRMEQIRPTLERAFLHANASQWPVCLAMSGECVEVPIYAAD